MGTLSSYIQRFGRGLLNIGYLLDNPSYSAVRRNAGNRDLYRLLNKKWLPHGKIKTVLDVGANDGQSLTVFLSLFPQSTIALFEPNPHSVEILRQRTDTLPNVKIFGIACGSSSTHLPLHVSSFSPSSSLLKATTIQNIEFPEAGEEKDVIVAVERLDAIVQADSSLEGPFLLKIDVQGAELEVLKGVVHLLPQVEVVTCEINTVNFYEGQANLDVLLCFLIENGFRLVDVSEPVRSRQSDEMLYADFAFMRTSEVLPLDQ